MIRKIITVLTNLSVFRMLASFYWRGYLREIGWFESYLRQKPINGKKEPIPWVTYSFIDFITPRLKKDLVLLEFGSGYSTLFYSRHVNHVTAVEHDEVWYREILQTIPENAEIVLQPLGDGNYSGFAKSVATAPDIIVVDGRDRVNCIRLSMEALSVRGVMVLDDSERSEYQEAFDFMTRSGFKTLDFWGIAPGIFFRKCTTIFYKPGNCLEI